ncbi:hypothetical protein F5B21DRAFT_501355 [Xylaria acuta]|nr:hypothetical protein F5B21DRAFT_501355 [Xylaria acuta]
MVGNTTKRFRFVACGIILLTLVLIVIGTVQSGAFANLRSPPVRPFGARGSLPTRRRSNHYDTLNVGTEATDSELKRAYRKQVVQFHPDKAQRLSADEQETAKVLYDRATLAYEVLASDRRCEYDRDVMRATVPEMKTCLQRVARRREKKRQDKAAERARATKEERETKPKQARTRQANEKVKATRKERQETKSEHDSKELITYAVGSLVYFTMFKHKTFFTWLTEFSYYWFLWRFIG